MNHQSLNHQFLLTLTICVFIQVVAVAEETQEANQSGTKWIFSGDLARPAPEWPSGPLTIRVEVVGTTIETEVDVEIVGGGGDPPE